MSPVIVPPALGRAALAVAWAKEAVAPAEEAAAMAVEAWSYAAFTALGVAAFVTEVLLNESSS
jgi:hypothetical protein